MTTLSLELDMIAAEPQPDAKLDWIKVAIDRHGEGYILDADDDFYDRDIILELFATDNGLRVPKGLAVGLYTVSNVSIAGGTGNPDDDWFEMSGTWTRTEG